MTDDAAAPPTGPFTAGAVVVHWSDRTDTLPPIEAGTTPLCVQPWPEGMPLSAHTGDGTAPRCWLWVADRLDRLEQAPSTLDAGVSMPHMMTILLADDPGTETMHTAQRLGVRDVVTAAYARQNLPELLCRYVAADGTMRSGAQQWDQVLEACTAMERMRSDADFYADLLRLFLDEIPERRAALRQTWWSDPAQAASRCHSLKGLARTLGLPRLDRAAAEAEAYASGRALADATRPQEALWLRLDAEMLSSSYQILRWLAEQPIARKAAP